MSYLLEQARVNRGVSLEEVEQAAGSTETTWRNWGGDDHSTMPEPIYVRSFVKKTYANYLDLDGDELAAQIKVPAGTGGVQARSPVGSLKAVASQTAFSDQVGSRRDSALCTIATDASGSLNARTRFLPKSFPVTEVLYSASGVGTRDEFRAFRNCICCFTSSVGPKSAKRVRLSRARAQKGARATISRADFPGLIPS